MNESTSDKIADNARTIRKRIKADYVEASALTDPNAPHLRRDLLRLIICWLDDTDRRARESGNETGCEDDTILEFLTNLKGQKQKSRDAHLSAANFIEARNDLHEIDIIETYLPQKLNADTLGGEVKAVVQKLGAKKLKDLPACIDALEAQFPGQIDPKLARGLVQKALG